MFYNKNAKTVKEKIFVKTTASAFVREQLKPKNKFKIMIMNLNELKSELSYLATDPKRVPLKKKHFIEETYYFGEKEKNHLGTILALNVSRLSSKYYKR